MEERITGEDDGAIDGEGLHKGYFPPWRDRRDAAEGLVLGSIDSQITVVGRNLALLVGAIEIQPSPKLSVENQFAAAEEGAAADLAVVY